MKRSGHESRSFTTVIGDVVGSRKHSDQRSLFEHLDRALSWVNERVAAVQDLQITVGDEFQGVYHDLGRALDAALLVRLRVWDSCHLRFGLGTGEIDSFKPESRPFSQSGSAWWLAREAIDSVVAHESKKGWPRSLRTWLRSEDARLESAINGFLLCRDQVLDRMDREDARVLLGLFLGETQDTVARDLGIKQPSVSSRQHAKGANAVYRAHLVMKGLGP